MNRLIYRCLYIIIFISIINSTAYSQTDLSWFSWPDGLGLSNQLEYSYNTDTEREILEDWLNLDFTKGIFSTGLRFEAFQPNDPDPSISRGKDRYTGIDFKYIRADIGDINNGVDITAGNFYTLFGRGLVLKIYEDRSIRVDNNLIGLKVTGKYGGFVLTGLTGTAANINNERKDILHAVDLEYKGWRFLQLGASMATNLPATDGIARTTMAAFRLLPSFWNFDIYAEYTAQFNDDIKQKIFKGNESIVGQGFYGNLNFYLGSLSLLGEYKYYDNIAFTSEDGTIYYNTPPSVRQEYTYVLPNRHPSPLNQDNEQGFEVGAGYNLADNTYLYGAYTQTKTLPAGSFYQRVLFSDFINNEPGIPVQTQLKEVYLQGQQDWNDNLTTLLAFAYNEELATNTKNVTPILENRFYFSDINTIKLVIEHQQVTDRTTLEKYYTDVLSLEYLRSPGFNIIFVSELQTKEPEEGKIIRRYWGFIQAGYKIGQHTDISLLIGTRQAGNICIGGVCRYEPAFKGIELKMQTRL